MDLILGPLAAVYFALSVIAATLFIIKLGSYYNKISKKQWVFTILFFPVPLLVLILGVTGYCLLKFLIRILDN